MKASDQTRMLFNIYQSEAACDRLDKICIKRMYFDRNNTALHSRKYERHTIFLVPHKMSRSLERPL